MGLLDWFRRHREHARAVDAHERDVAAEAYSGDAVEPFEEPLGTPGKGQTGAPPAPGLLGPPGT
jgi:hypothetical protein